MSAISTTMRVGWPWRGGCTPVRKYITYMRALIWYEFVFTCVCHLYHCEGGVNMTLKMRMCSCTQLRYIHRSIWYKFVFTCVCHLYHCEGGVYMTLKKRMCSCTQVLCICTRQCTIAHAHAHSCMYAREIMQGWWWRYDVMTHIVWFTSVPDVCCYRGLGKHFGIWGYPWIHTWMWYHTICHMSQWLWCRYWPFTGWWWPWVTVTVCTCRHFLIMVNEYVIPQSPIGVVIHNDNDNFGPNSIIQHHYELYNRYNTISLTSKFLSSTIYKHICSLDGITCHFVMWCNAMRCDVSIHLAIPWGMKHVFIPLFSERSVLSVSFTRNLITLRLNKQIYIHVDVPSIHAHPLCPSQSNSVQRQFHPPARGKMTRGLQLHNRLTPLVSDAYTAGAIR